MKLTWLTGSRLWHAGAAIFYIWLAFSAVSLLWEIFGSKPEIPRATSKFFGLCKSTVKQEIESPDMDKVAMLEVSDCGATTGWQTRISINNKVTKKIYPLLMLQGRPDDYKIIWENGYTVVAAGFAIENILELRKDDFAGAKVEIRPTDLDKCKR